jgi:hypothetical protein
MDVFSWLKMGSCERTLQFWEEWGGESDGARSGENAAYSSVGIYFTSKN